jgi:hypothetical protein
MKNTKAILPWTIRILVAFLFIISAIAKMYPSPYFAISTFEVKQLYTLGFSESIAPYFSRTLIGIEMALGILLLQKNYLKNFIIPATILLIAVFVGHLSYVTFLSGGNSGNCGCFGELIPMTPIQAIIKNIVAIGLLAYLFTLLPKTLNGNFWVLTTVLFASILGIFMLAPIQAPASPYAVSPIEEVQTDSVFENNSKIIPVETQPITTNDAIAKTDTIKKVETQIVDEPAKHKSGNGIYFSKIDNGRKILCFFVPGCDHCRLAAKELTEMRSKIKDFPQLSIVFMNEEADLIPDFFKEAGATYPYKIIEIIPFWKALGTGKDTPVVKYLWNGNELKTYYGITENKFNATEFQEFVQKKYSELKK